MKKDLITVIIPVYNHENYVQLTINSIIEQTYSNIELIVINDGSKDKSNEMIAAISAECEQRFFNFIHIDKKNEGIIKALNMGIKKAQGKYLYIIASDDIAEKDALTVLHEFLSANADYGLAVGGNSLMDDNGLECYWDKNRNNVYTKNEAVFISFDDYLRKSRKNIDFLTEDFGNYRSILTGNYIPNGYLLDKSIVDNFGGYSDKAPLEDFYLMLQMSKITKLKFIDQSLFRYRWHANNSIKNIIRIRKMRHQTLLHECTYCLRNGYFSLWFNKTYGRTIKYRLSKILTIMKRTLRIN